jgi:hypothetical protein
MNDTRQTPDYDALLQKLFKPGREITWEKYYGTGTMYTFGFGHGIYYWNNEEISLTPKECYDFYRWLIVGWDKSVATDSLRTARGRLGPKFLEELMKSVMRKPRGGRPSELRAELDMLSKAAKPSHIYREATIPVSSNLEDMLRQFEAFAREAAASPRTCDEVIKLQVIMAGQRAKKADLVQQLKDAIVRTGTTSWKLPPYEFRFAEGAYFREGREIKVTAGEALYLYEWLVEGIRDSAQRSRLADMRVRLGKSFLQGVTGKGGVDETS